MSNKKQTAAKPVAPKRQNTRQKLVDAAHALIWANSYVHVSVEDICREAGVQKGSFYHFFPTKSDLAAAALVDHWDQKQCMMDAIFDVNSSAQQQLQACCAEIYAKQQESLIATGKVCGCPYATVGSEMGGSNEALRAISEQMTERFLGYLEKLLSNAVREGLIPAAGIKQRAAEMHVYIIGAMLQARMTNRLDTVGKSMEVALHRISGIPPLAAAKRKRAA